MINVYKYIIVMFLVLMSSGLATLMYSQDFDDLTLGFNYGELVAEKFTCRSTASDTTDCFTSGLGTAGVTITQVNGSINPTKALLIYSDYTATSTGVKTGTIWLNLSSYDMGNFSVMTDIGISYNMMVSYIDDESPSEPYNYYLNDIYKTTTDKTVLTFASYVSAMTSPGSTYSGWRTNWDEALHNANNYPYTFTGFWTGSGSLDEVQTSQFTTHGSCYFAEDTWNSVYILYEFAPNLPVGGDDNEFIGMTFYVNGTECWSADIEDAVRVKTLSDYDQVLGFGWRVKNQFVIIDNLRIYSYENETGQQTWDLLNDSVIVNGNFTIPSTGGSGTDASINPLDAIFGDYSDGASMFISLILIVTLAFLGWKFAGFYGGTLGGILGIISSTIFGWLPGWVLFLLILVIAAMFAKKLAVE